MVVKGMGPDKNLEAEIGYPSDIEIRQNGQRFRVCHKLWPVNTHMLKQLIYATLSTNTNNQTDRFIFTDICDEEFFKQLTSETFLKHTDDKGETKPIWKQTYKHNHVLDMMVYNYAVYYRYNLHLKKDSDWEWLLKAGDIIREKKIREMYRKSNELAALRHQSNYEW
jgi:phage terminase large subunit GpA-like protein